MKISHQQKVKLARRLQLQEANNFPSVAVRKHIMATSIFDTQSWKTRKEKIVKRVDQTIANQVLMKAKRENQNGEKSHFTKV